MIENIKKKINALLQKTTENGASEAEALAALKKATELMREYFISESDLHNNINTNEKCVFERVKIIQSKYSFSCFYNNLAKLFDCEHFYNKYYITFFGHENDVNMCIYFYNFIIRSAINEKDLYKKTASYQKASKLAHSRTVCHEFIKGFCYGINDKMKDLYQSRYEGLSKCTQLMVISRKQNVDVQFAAFNFDIKTIKKHLTVKTHAFDKGREKGENYNIVVGIDAKNEVEQLKLEL